MTLFLFTSEINELGTQTQIMINEIVMATEITCLREHN